MLRRAGVLMAVGSILLVAVVFFPIYQDVFGKLDDPAAMANSISGDEFQWAIASLLFGLGGLVAAVGIWMLSKRLGDMSGQVAVGYVAGIGAAVGGALFALVTVQRIVNSPEEAASVLANPDWTFAVLSLSSQITLIAVGYLMVLSFKKWLGWLLVLAGVGTMIGYFVAGDMPPAVYYPVWLIAALVLLFSRQPEPASA
ncbi:MAG TPA: DUF4386 family protein [Acidimicrobiia bacterium]|nr:DUF4386 family protein [Acidimicrobiia bacterium]